MTIVRYSEDGKICQLLFCNRCKKQIGGPVYYDYNLTQDVGKGYNIYGDYTPLETHTMVKNIERLMVSVLQSLHTVNDDCGLMVDNKHYCKSCVDMMKGNDTLNHVIEDLVRERNE